MDVILTIVAIVVVLLALGLGLRRWRGSDRIRTAESSALEIVDALISALGPEDHGVLVLDDDGRLRESNESLPKILRSPIPLHVDEDHPIPLETWAEDVMPEDRAAIKSWLTDPSARTSPLSIRLQASPDIRWLRLVHIRPTRLGRTVLLVDESEHVERRRTERTTLRNARLSVQVSDAIAAAETTEDAITDVLAVLRNELDLRTIGWYAIHPESGEIAPFASAPDGPTGMDPLPADVLAAMKDPFGRLAGGLPLLPDQQDGRLLLPILANGELSDVLVLHPTRPDTWDTDTTDHLIVVADRIGRRIEQFIGEEEREAWASTRGSLERAEAIANLTGRIAHDFNGVLFAIQGRLELLRGELGTGRIQDDVDEIDNAIVEAKRLAERLRSALRGDEDPVPINVASELETIVESGRRLLPASMDLDCHIQPAVRDTKVVLYAPANALEQIILHLIVNARDALGTRGRIMLGARLHAEDRLEIRIDDDGPGIPPEDRDRLVEPYETGESSVGTGLGLAICKRLVIQRHGDFRLLESPLGGLAVSMEFPIRQAEPRTTGVAPRVEERAPSRVLVVEDNTIIRDVLVRVFQGTETEVVARGDASDVEAILARYPETDLLIFDIDLPGRSGIECLQDLRAQGVQIPCLLITGGITDPPALDRIAFLRKPFRIDALRRTASQLLVLGSD